MKNTKSLGVQHIPKMHWLVMGWFGISGYFALAFPVAMWRVSQDPKFIGQAVRSQDCTTREPQTRVVITSMMCTEIVAQPLPAKK
jgi:hypothetical protein